MAIAVMEQDCMDRPSGQKEWPLVEVQHWVVSVLRSQP